MLLALRWIQPGHGPAGLEIPLGYAHGTSLLYVAEAQPPLPPCISHTNTAPAAACCVPFASCSRLPLCSPWSIPPCHSLHECKMGSVFSSPAGQRAVGTGAALLWPWLGSGSRLQAV